jgi:hypothetical protein
VTVVQAEICSGDVIDVVVTAGGQGDARQRKTQLITIVVKLPSGRTVSINTSLAATVAVVKGIVRRLARVELPAEVEFDLTIRHGTETVTLPSAATMDECGVRTESVLNAVIDHSNELFIAEADSFWRALGRILYPVYNAIVSIIRLIRPMFRPIWTVARHVHTAILNIWRLISRASSAVNRSCIVPTGRLLNRIWTATATAMERVDRRVLAPTARWTRNLVDRSCLFTYNNALVPLGRAIRWSCRNVSRFTYNNLLVPLGRALRWACRLIGRAIRNVGRFTYNNLLVPVGRTVRWSCRLAGRAIRNIGRFLDWAIKSVRNLRIWNRSRRTSPSAASAPGLISRALTAIGRVCRRWLSNVFEVARRFLRFVFRNAVLPLLRGLGRVLVRLWRHALEPLWRLVVSPVLVRLIRWTARALSFLFRILGIQRFARWLNWRGFAVGNYAVDVTPHVRFVAPASVGEQPLFVMRDRSQYSVRIYNNSPVGTRCNLSIDGQAICSLLLQPRSSYVIEKPPESIGRFTFRISEAARAAAAAAHDGAYIADPDDRNAGTIVAQFIPRRLYTLRAARARARRMELDAAEDGGRGSCSSSSSKSSSRSEPEPAPAPSATAPAAPAAPGAGALIAGRTTLEGESDQTFHMIRGFDGDTARAVTISVRLVGSNH